MANRAILLCLLLALLTVNLIECKGGGRGGGHRSSGGSHGGWFSSGRSSSSGSRWGSSSGSSSSSSHWGSSSGSSGNSWGSSSGSYSKPSWSSGTSHSYPSSSSGISGYGTSHSYPSSSSGSGSSHGYPSSSSGMSGYGSSQNYPSSSSGMSGSGSSHNYPSSPSGKSGYGSSNNYPSSSSGMSGSGSSHNYPSSPSGKSGYGSSHSYPPSSSGISGSGKSTSTSHSYPPSRGGSGSGVMQSSSFGGVYYPPSSSGSGNQKHTYPSPGIGISSSSGNNYRPSSSNVYHPSNTYNTNNKYYNHNTHGYGYNTYNPPSYYSAPQYQYIIEYRQSGSRYNDLLTGLTLYNLGRSHSHYHNQYYYDDYYNRRYNTPGSSFYSGSTSSYDKPKESAVCKLKIKDQNSVETLKIPCEIVSTFTQDSKKVTTQNTVNTTVCVTEIKVVNNSSPNNITQFNATASNEANKTLSEANTNTTIISNNNSTAINANNTELINSENNTYSTNSMNITGVNNITNISSMNTERAAENKTLNITLESKGTEQSSVFNSNNTNVVNDPLLVQPITPINASLIATNVTTTTPLPAVDSNTPNVSQVQIIKCTTNVTTTDPLTVKGPAINPSGLECVVEIETGGSLLQNKVDCDMLIKYARMPEPKKEASSIMPSRSKLKSWLESPPWWMSMFIAV